MLQVTPMTRLTQSSSGASLSAPPRRSGSFLPCIEPRPVTPLHRWPGSPAEPSLHHIRRLNVVPSTAKGGPYPRQEVIHVRRKETGKLLLCSSRSVHDEGEKDEGEGEIFRREGENVDCNVCVRVVLGEGVREGEDEGLQEEVAF